MTRSAEREIGELRRELLALRARVAWYERERQLLWGWADEGLAALWATRGWVRTTKTPPQELLDLIEQAVGGQDRGLVGIRCRSLPTDSPD